VLLAHAAGVILLQRWGAGLRFVQRATSFRGFLSMADLISGLSDDDIATEWRRERATDTTADDDDATDPKEDVDGTDDADGVDPDTGPSDSDADESDS
jgi:hypothetical protein